MQRLGLLQGKSAVKNLFMAHYHGSVNSTLTLRDSNSISYYIRSLLHHTSLATAGSARPCAFQAHIAFARRFINSFTPPPFDPIYLVGLHLVDFVGLVLRPLPAVALPCMIEPLMVGEGLPSSDRASSAPNELQVPASLPVLPTVLDALGTLALPKSLLSAFFFFFFLGDRDVVEALSCSPLSSETSFRVSFFGLFLAPLLGPFSAPLLLLLLSFLSQDFPSTRSKSAFSSASVGRTDSVADGPWPSAARYSTWSAAMAADHRFQPGMHSISGKYGCRSKDGSNASKIPASACRIGFMSSNNGSEYRISRELTK